MLAGGTKGTDRGQHIPQQVELIGDKRIYADKILRISIDLFQGSAAEGNQVFDSCFLLFPFKMIVWVLFLIDMVIYVS